MLAEHQKDYEKLLASRRKLAKLSNDVRSWEAGDYPPGQKPFKPSFESDELDMQATEIPAMNFQLDLKGSFREIKERLYKAYKALNTVLDRRMMELRVGGFTKRVDNEVFLMRCTTIAAEKNDAVQRIADLAGITLPAELRPKSESVANISRATALVLYHKTLERIAKKEEERAEKERAAKLLEQKIEDKLTSMEPQELWQHAVSHEVDKKLGRKPGAAGIDYVGLLHGKTDVHAEAAKASKSSPGNQKNWPAPGGTGAAMKAKGTKSPKNQSGKGSPARQSQPFAGKSLPSKGKGKGKGLKTGKGKGQPKASPTAGKGKGKQQQWQIPVKGKGSGKQGGKASVKGAGSGKANWRPKGKSKGKGRVGFF